MNLNDPNQDPLRPRASMIPLAFGLFVLAFLIAIDEPERLNLRSASALAAAMSFAGFDPAREGARDL